MNIYQSELYHHGIKGMRWGVRRYQNVDGSLTAAGKKRYSTGEAVLKTVKKILTPTILGGPKPSDPPKYAKTDGIEKPPKPKFNVIKYLSVNKDTSVTSISKKKIEFGKKHIHISDKKVNSVYNRVSPKNRNRAKEKINQMLNPGAGTRHPWDEKPTKTIPWDEKPSKPGATGNI